MSHFYQSKVTLARLSEKLEDSNFDGVFDLDPIFQWLDDVLTIELNLLAESYYEGKRFLEEHISPLFEDNQLVSESLLDKLYSFLSMLASTFIYIKNKLC